MSVMLQLSALKYLRFFRSNLLSALKNFNHHNILPIFTTTEDDLEVIKKVNGLNGLDVMEKPFSFKEVIERIESYFRNHEVSM